MWLQIHRLNFPKIHKSTFQYLQLNGVQVIHIVCSAAAAFKFRIELRQLAGSCGGRDALTTSIHTHLCCVNAGHIQARLLPPHTKPSLSGTGTLRLGENVAGRRWLALKTWRGRATSVSFADFHAENAPYSATSFVTNIRVSRGVAMFSSCFNVRLRRRWAWVGLRRLGMCRICAAVGTILKVSRAGRFLSLPMR